MTTILVAWSSNAVCTCGGGEGRGGRVFVANIKRTFAACSKNTQQVFLHGCHDAESLSSPAFPGILSVIEFSVSGLVLLSMVSNTNVYIVIYTTQAASRWTKQPMSFYCVYFVQCMLLCVYFVQCMLFSLGVFINCRNTMICFVINTISTTQHSTTLKVTLPTTIVAQCLISFKSCDCNCIELPT